MGIGFVVGSREIVTCAHVVNAALGRDKNARERPDGSVRVQIDFVLLGDTEGAPLRNCKIAAWDPPTGPDAPGRDVAGLVLVGGDALPARAGPARLLKAGTRPESEASVFGYPGNPPGRVNGAWSGCRLRGAIGGGLIQLDTDSESALRVQPGYSGAPVIVADEWGDAVVGMLTTASRDGVERDAYAVSPEELARAWPRVLGRRVLPPSPYRGLRTFTAADARAGVFVGRENEIARLRKMIKERPAVVAVGPSGVGKSSLVAAGLAPSLSSEGWSIASFRPGTSPFDALARALLEFERPGAARSLEDLESRVASLRRDGFWEVASRLALLTGRRLALVCDQFEEVLSFARSDDEVVRFLRTMLPEQDDRLSSAPVRLVCTLRADFLPTLLDLPEIGPRLQDRQLNVSPLDEAALTRVIVEPAALAGVTYAPDLAETIARDAGRGPGALPLLEFALTELWLLQNGGVLSFDHYHELGGVAGALNRHAEKVHRGLSEELDESRIRRVLLALVRARGGAASAVRAVGRRDHLGADWQVAERLAAPAHRLIVIGPEGPETAEIAHEAIIREWDRLAGWVDEDAEFQRWLTVVEDRAAENEPLTEARLAEAGRWLSERGADIPGEVAQHIAYSRAVIESRERTEQLLTESMRLARELQARSDELQRQHVELRSSNAELEEKAALLAKQNRAIEIQNYQIEQARRTLEERAEQLAISSRYKSEFLANVSHELRTPLHSLLVLAKLLLENQDGNLTGRQVEFAQTIHNAGTDLLTLINDIIDLAKAEAGKMELHSRWVPVDALVRYVDVTFRALTIEKRLRFEIAVAPDVPGKLYTDEPRLRQVLRNLLSNAVKFTPEGEVRLLIERVGDAGFMPLALWNTPDVIAFRVIDTGIGMSADDLEVIFEAFERSGGAARRRHGGTGLGLSSSQNNARVLGGEIHAESKPGHGSVFTL
ncbi:ATP-binding protein, partial [Actinomadura sp. LOL_011]|uniref:nSTAND1 domain-containing NTPase n=1 Tax=Actinomadura sp. LOL_011 TaxID=3345410 RepID=UPI003A811C85